MFLQKALSMFHCNFISWQQELRLILSYYHFSVFGSAAPAGDPIQVF